MQGTHDVHTEFWWGDTKESNYLEQVRWSWEGNNECLS